MDDPLPPTAAQPALDRARSAAHPRQAAGERRGHRRRLQTNFGVGRRTSAKPARASRDGTHDGEAARQQFSLFHDDDASPTGDSQEPSPDGRWRAYTYAELIGPDKASLDIFWLRDECLEDSARLPEPHVLAGEIADDLRAALEQIEDILVDLPARAGLTARAAARGGEDGSREVDGDA